MLTEQDSENIRPLDVAVEVLWLVQYRDYNSLRAHGLILGQKTVDNFSKVSH